MSDFWQSVVFAGGVGKRFGVISSEDVPKAMLPVGNRPLLSYPLNMLETAGFSEVIVIAAGDVVAKCVSKYVERYAGRMHVQVVAVAEDAGTATALRSVSERLTTDNVLVLSGDLVCDVGPAMLASSHCARGAIATALLAQRKQITDPETGKPTAPEDYIGLDAAEERMVFFASAAGKKEVKVRRAILSHNGQLTIRTDLLDTHMYIFSKRALAILKRHASMTSIKEHLLPYLARRQFTAALTDPKAEAEPESIQDEMDQMDEDEAPPEPAHSVQSGEDAEPTTKMTEEESKRNGVFVEFVPADKYAQRVNTIDVYRKTNYEVASPGEAAHLTGYTISKHDNVVGKTVDLGQKATIGPACIVGERCILGDKSSIKRSVLGNDVKLGNGVKVMNCVIGENVVIEDGCHLHNSIICANAVLREKCSLRDCQVAAGYEVEGGVEFRSEELAE